MEITKCDVFGDTVCHSVFCVTQHSENLNTEQWKIQSGPAKVKPTYIFAGNI